MRLTLLMMTLWSVSAYPAFADDIQPGLWELTLTVRVPATPGFSMPPTTINQCLTEQDAKDPSAVLGGVANPGATGCTFSDKSYTNNTLHFKMQCAGTLAIQTQGNVTYSATSIEGSLVSSANVKGQKTELHSKITARRIGGC